MAGPGVDNVVFIEFQNLDVLIGYFCSSQKGQCLYYFFSTNLVHSG